MNLLSSILWFNSDEFIFFERRFDVGFYRSSLAEGRPRVDRKILIFIGLAGTVSLHVRCSDMRGLRMWLNPHFDLPKGVCHVMNSLLSVKLILNFQGHLPRMFLNITSELDNRFSSSAITWNIDSKFSQLHLKLADGKLFLSLSNEIFNANFL